MKLLWLRVFPWKSLFALLTGSVAGTAIGFVVAWFANLLEFCSGPASMRESLMDMLSFGFFGGLLGLSTAWPVRIRQSSTDDLEKL